MKTRLLVPLVGLAISFALPTFGQQKDTVDPKITEQIRAIAKKYDEASNNSDAAAIAALFTEDAVFVTDTGPIYGRQAIQKWHEGVFKNEHISNHLIKADQDSPHVIGTADNVVWENGEWSETVQGKSFGPIQVKGYWGVVDVRESDEWQIRMLTWNVTPAPAATASPTASPSNQ